MRIAKFKWMDDKRNEGILKEQKSYIRQYFKIQK